MAPDTRDPRQQILNVLNYWYPGAIDHVHGGYVLQRDEVDGHVYDGRSRHLVGTCRAIFNFCVGDLVGGPHWCRSAAEHGVRFLLDAHRDETGGLHWLLDGRDPVDRTHYCYGHAFGLLALATATKVGISGAERALGDLYDRLDEAFWESERSLCLAEIGPDWTDVREYRGQNANMHACEALIAAHEATGRDEFLDRAYAIAEALVRDLAAATDGRIWEHYTADWEHDFAYNRDDPRHTFRPWGYQPGHHLEWAKLLLALDRHREEPWLRDRAVELFEIAAENGWDDDRGGFVYTFDRDGDPIVEERYGWTVAEGIGAAALLGSRVDDGYWEWYDRLWAYARDRFVNPRYGTWYEAVTPDADLPREPDPGPVVEPGDHPVSNAFETLRALDESVAGRAVVFSAD